MLQTIKPILYWDAVSSVQSSSLSITLCLRVIST
jgi:hypothetical protein